MRSTLFLLLCFAIVGCVATPDSTVPTQSTDEAGVVTLDPVALGAATDPEHPDFLRTHLTWFGLEPLSTETSGETVDRYRFLWCRWLAVPALFEVSFDSFGSGEYRAMIWKKDGGTERWETVKVRRLDAKDRDWFRMLTERWKLLDAPWYDGRAVFDGSSWFFEIQNDGKLNQIYRASPEWNEVRWFGEQLIEMGIDSPFVPIQ